MAHVFFPNTSCVPGRVPSPLSIQSLLSASQQLHEVGTGSDYLILQMEGPRLTQGGHSARKHQNQD